jgi:hypothetical protein
MSNCGTFDCGLRIEEINPQSAIRNPQSNVPQSKKASPCDKLVAASEASALREVLRVRGY